MSDDVKLSARSATDGDLDVIETLRQLALDELHDARGGLALFDHDRPQLDFDQAPTRRWVGSVDDVVVGMAEAVVDQGPSLRIVLITDLYVHPDARGVGVGAALLEQVQTWATDHGATHLESQVLPGLRDSKNFFERMGMVTRQMRVSRPIA